MITTTREAINALDLFHQAIAEVMIDKGMLRIVEEGEQHHQGASE